MRNFAKTKALTALAALTIVLACAVFPQFAVAQATTGTLRGTVTDPNGQVVSGATVTVKNQDTNVTSSAFTTNESGSYVIPNLLPGKYTVTVESAAGFSRKVVTDVAVSLGQTNDVNVALAIGQTSETVTVTGATEEIIQRDTAQVSSTFETRKVAELPSNAAGGGIDTLALLAPGVVPGFGNVNSNGVSLSVNGNRARSNNFTIDGTDNNDITIGGPSYFVDNQDQVQEFQIITNNFSAQYGRNQGAIVNIVTKGGGNQFHGSLFEFYRNSSALDAQTNLQRRDPGQGNRRDKFISNVFGGTFGGPLPLPRFGEGGRSVISGKDRVFFFGSFQEAKQRTDFLDKSNNLAILPSEFPRLAAAFPGNAAVQAIINQSAFALTGLGTVTPRTDRPRDTVNIGGQIFQAAFPQRLFATPVNAPEFSIRVDANATKKDTFLVRYLYQKSDNVNQLGGVRGFTGNIPTNTKNLSGTYNRQISTRAVNEFRATYQKLDILFGGGSSLSPLAGGITSPTDIGSTFTNINLSGVRGISTGTTLLGIGPATNLPQGRIVSVQQFADNFTVTLGRSTIITGADLRRLNTTVPFLPNINGAFTFTSGARVASNTPTRVTLGAGDPNIKFKEFDRFFFFQDDYRVRDNLTLNLGIRYEFTGQPINSLNESTVARESNASTALFRQDLPLAIRTVPRVQSDKNNFAPRFGFAYTPRFGKKLFGEDATVIRGGYSIAYDPGFYNIFLNVSTSSPAVFLNTINNTTTAPFSLPVNPTGNVVRANLSGQIQRNTFDPRFFAQTIIPTNFHSPYSQQYSIGIQRQINRNNVAEVRYLGTHGVGLFQSINRNPNFNALFNGIPNISVAGADANGNPINTATFNFPAFRQFIPNGVVPVVSSKLPGTPDNEAVANGRLLPGRGLIRSRENTGQSTYNSLQARYNGRLFNQLTLGASYTFSKTLDNASEIFSFGESAFASNPFDLNRNERSLSGVDRKHAASFNFLYDIPYLKEQKGVIGKLLGGFQINSTYIVASGRPFTPSQFFNLFGGIPTYQDNTFNGSFLGQDSLRPFNGNPKAGPTTVGITDVDAALLGFTNGFIASPTGFYSLNAFNTSGRSVSVTPNDVRYIFNGPGAAQRFNNPFGNVARNSQRGPRLNQANLGIFKNTNITERVKLQFRAEAFNVFNHPNAGYGVAAGDTLLDRFIEDAGSTFNDRGEANLSSRRLQFGLRLTF